MQSPHGIKSEAFRAPVMAKNGMVASAHPLASQAGIQAMMSGGNAVDGAIATAAALGVVDPANSGTGGDGFIMIYWAESNLVTCVNATGPAPCAASREVYLKDGGIPYERHSERFRPRNCRWLAVGARPLRRVKTRSGFRTCNFALRKRFPRWRKSRGRSQRGNDTL